MSLSTHGHQTTHWRGAPPPWHEDAAPAFVCRRAGHRRPSRDINTHTLPESPTSPLAPGPPPPRLGVALGCDTGGFSFFIYFLILVIDYYIRSVSLKKI